MKLYCIVRDCKRGNKLLDHLVVNRGGARFAYGAEEGGIVDMEKVLLLPKSAAETLATAIGDCQAVPHLNQRPQKEVARR